ncbi:hypothetical protein H0W26_03680 [Candidatus Dependentiae bacterium]|nr:hypothetical protein [Candidatus Dependentiae bacterium]
MQWYGISFLCFLTMIVGIKTACCPSEPKNNNLSTVLFNEAYRPTDTLLQLLKLMNIEHDSTLQSIVSETQKQWLRPRGQERWGNQKEFTYTYDELSQTFEDLYLIQEIKPACKNYTYAVLLGGTISCVRNRLSFLIKLWNEGIRFKNIIILSGERPLDNSIESQEIIVHPNCASLPLKRGWRYKGKLPTTETEMIKFVLDQTELPHAWNSLPLVFINTPLQKTEQGAVRRPTTHDTVKEWLTEHHPKPGSVLSVSTQPFIGYQHSVLRALLPKDFVLHTVGNSIDSIDMTIGTVLDSLARWIYNEHRMRKASL